MLVLLVLLVLLVVVLRDNAPQLLIRGDPNGLRRQVEFKAPEVWLLVPLPCCSADVM